MKTLIKVKTKQNIFKLLVLWFIMFFGTIATILLEQEDGKVVPIIALVILIVAGITTCLKNKIFATVIAAIFVMDISSHLISENLYLHSVLYAVFPLL